VVLDCVVGPTGQELCDLRPPVPEGFVGLENLRASEASSRKGCVSGTQEVSCCLVINHVHILTFRSSSTRQGDLLMLGFRWLCQRSLHCLPMRPGRWDAIKDHWESEERREEEMD
jgi:hypothetical protein